MSTEVRNRQLRLARRPVGRVDDETFELVEEPLRPLVDGEALVRTVYLSVDPTQRIWIREEESYLPPVAIGEVMRSGAVGTVVESRSAKYPVGAVVTGLLGWQEHAYVDDASAANVVPPALPMRQLLGVLGANGVTAYFGMLEVGRAEPGDVVVVSGAAGATGSIAAQIAKIVGCRVVGIAGTPEKCGWLTELGIDAAIDYRTEDVEARIAELCPEGVDVFFDNVGGATLDAVLANLALHARVALCGAISTYNADGADVEPIRRSMNLVIRRARMEGFLVLDYADRFPDAVLQLATWVGEGRIRWRDQVVEGLERAPEALNMLFSGENTGKLLVQVAPDPG